MIAAAFAMAASAVTGASAYDFVQGGVYYNILSNTSTRKTVALTYFTTNPDASGYVSTYRGDVVIPAQVSYNLQTFNVTQVSDLAMFNNQGLYSLVLPEGVSSIGSQAFSHCYSLYDISLPSTVFRIADYAFEYCEDLTSITLPAALGDMGDGVFQQCFGLAEINVDEANSGYVSIDGVLYSGKGSAAGLYMLAYPGGKRAKSFVMPDNVYEIDSYALSANLNLESITLSPALSRIPSFTFSECESLAEINVAEGNKNFKGVDGVLFNADGTLLVQYPVAREGIEYEVPEGVETIGDASFNQAYFLTDLVFPSTLKLVEELAFYGVRSIRSVTCMATVPPKGLDSSLIQMGGIFDSSVYKYGELYVPAEAVEAYKADPDWGRFAKIYAIGEAGIDEIEETAAPAEYFGIDGRKVEKPAGGLYIVRRGTAVTKELVK